MVDAPVTMSIITEGAGTHFLIFLQHMIITGSKHYGVESTPLHSNNRWDKWSHGLEFQIRGTIPGQSGGIMKRNIKLSKTWWNVPGKESTEERLEYFNDIIVKHGAIHFGMIHHYPTWLEEHFSNINILFYVGETAEVSKKCWNLSKMKNGSTREFDPQLGDHTRIAVQKNPPICTVDYDDLYTKNDRESVRKFINFTLSIRATEAQLDLLQYWIDLYTAKNDKLLLNYSN